MLLLIVPEKRATSWLMIVYFGEIRVKEMRREVTRLTMRVLRSSRPSVDMSMPSILVKRF
jgi:hypothetical protein